MVAWPSAVGKRGLRWWGADVCLSRESDVPPGGLAVFWKERAVLRESCYTRWYRMGTETRRAVLWADVWDCGVINNKREKREGKLGFVLSTSA